MAAFEVPLASPADRSDFLSLLSRVAELEGLHVDAATDAELAQQAQAGPDFRHTIRAAVWRGTGDSELEASILDLPDNLGQAWITFLRGEDPALADQFREHAMREIRLRWPETLTLPIMPSGAIPLPADLVRTSDGYVLNPAAASTYGIPTSP